MVEEWISGILCESFKCTELDRNSYFRGKSKTRSCKMQGGGFQTCPGHESGTSVSKLRCNITRWKKTPGGIKKILQPCQRGSWRNSLFDHTLEFFRQRDALNFCGC